MNFATATPRSRRRVVMPALVTLLLSALAVTPIVGGTSSAAFTTTTDNLANAATTLTVAPPTSVAATMTLNIVPLATCKSSVAWTASTTPGVTYEIERFVTLTSLLDAGPWTVGATSYVDAAVPLQLLNAAYSWRIRARLGNWTSTWVTASPINLIACLL